MSYMGVDIGTSGCKAVVFDEQGIELASAYREYAVLSPREGWAELDSSLVLEKCFEVIKEAAVEVPNDPVQGLGISSQGEAFTPIGKDGRLMGNAMVSSDSRAAHITESWSSEFGRERLYEITGHTPYPMFTLYKLLWVRDNQPEVWQNAASFYCFEELLQWKLGLDPAISWPLAGRTMIFNVRTHRWDDTVLDAVGLDPKKLARTLPSGAVVGTIPPAIARELELPDDVIVVTGGHDQTCGALGAGVTSAGKAMYATGTVECICPAFPSPVFSEDLFTSNLCTYDFTIEGMYTTVAFSLTGGNLLKWFRDEWGREEIILAAKQGKSAYELILADLPDEPTKLMVLPYFTPTGTPYFDTNTKGAILGLRLTTKREEVLRALLEGVAFEMRLNLDILDRAGLPVSELLAIGGGARNRRWTQLKADVLGKPVSTVAVTEAGCLGVAMLACAAKTGTDVRSLVNDWVRVTNIIEPDPVKAETYDEQFEIYKKLYPTLKTLF